MLNCVADVVASRTEHLAKLRHDATVAPGTSSVSALGSRQRLIHAALRTLGIERLVLTAHDAAFPDRPDEDVGRGVPGSAGAAAVLEYAAGDGFDTIQLGPQGKLSADNPSPYDGALFSRSPLSISLRRLVREGLLPASVLEQAVTELPAGSERRVRYRYTWNVYAGALRVAWKRFLSQGDAGARLDAFMRRHHDSLFPEVMFDTLAAIHATDDWTRWKDDAGDELDGRLYAPLPGEETACERRRSAILATHADEIGFHSFCQLLAHQEHQSVRRRASGLGLRLFGDFQTGISRRDAWRARALLLPGYVMGAPPSRTNLDGQPWGYPVLNPSLYVEPDRTAPGAALRFLRQRLEKLLDDYDGIRIDHPHGLVCPWVYRADANEPFAAVRSGARLFSSPDVSEHPELAGLAIARPDQLAPSGHPRYADDWVRALDAEQIDRYARAFDVLMDVAHERGLHRRDIACEVLSTCPMPLARVLARHRLGRFRVTQKADPADPQDPYRSETASPADWIMVGTHDTPPLALVLQTWGIQQRTRWAAYLGTRLAPAHADAGALADDLVRDDIALHQAMFVDLFLGPARQVKVFFADWLGMTEIYNRPGTAHEENWMLRIPRAFRSLHAQRREQGFALDMPRVLARALRTRVAGSTGDTADLAAALERCD